MSEGDKKSSTLPETDEHFLQHCPASSQSQSLNMGIALSLDTLAIKAEANAPEIDKKNLSRDK